ncbi:hypothetical protein N7452_007722 [Penicillium brevicompactum]|uniref:Uncharacterized protein n=1 Tax=Penicillium brevicompactum TaxID=5074 RepID=A0A9W9QFR4_PENBR|nr:hypothetical protein N7452_007722 [Penicillium brevicompactum]
MASIKGSNTVEFIFFILLFSPRILAAAVLSVRDQESKTLQVTENNDEEPLHLSALLNSEDIDPDSVCTSESSSNDECVPFFKLASSEGYKSSSILIEELRLFVDMAYGEDSHQTSHTAFNEASKVTGLDPKSEGLLAFPNASDLLHAALDPTELHSSTWKRQSTSSASLQDFAVKQAAAVVAGEVSRLKGVLSLPAKLVGGIANCNSVSRSAVDSCKKGVKAQVAFCKQKQKDTIATCKKDIAKKVDECKRRVRDRVATCKDNANKAVSNCLAEVGRTIDKCKKKAKDPFSKGACEAKRPGLKAGCVLGKLNVPKCEFGGAQSAACEVSRGTINAKCEFDRINIPLCEFDRLTAGCCEGARASAQANCQAGLSKERVQEKMDAIQQKCAILTAIAKAATKSYLTGQSIAFLGQLSAVKEIGQGIQMVDKLQKTQKQFESIANGVTAVAEGRINDANSLLSSLKGLPAPISTAQAWANTAQAVINGKADAALGSAIGAVAELQAIQKAVATIEKLKGVQKNLQEIKKAAEKCALAPKFTPANFPAFRNLKQRTDINKAMVEYRKFVEVPVKQLAECKAVGERINRLMKMNF